MSSFLWRGQDNRRLFNQTLTREEFERREARREANRKAKEQKNNVSVSHQPWLKQVFTNVVSNVKRFFGRQKH